MPAETILTQLKVLGGNAYNSAMTTAAARTESLDTATSRLGRTAKTTGGLVDSVGQKVLRYGRDLGTIAAVTGAAGVAIGLKFDASMERAEIGMETLLKNGKLAKRTTQEVRDFALKAPLFGVEQMLTSAQQLIGAGYDAKKIVPTLTTFSDTLSAMGRKPEDLQRMTYAFVQMMSKGQISAEELRGQLGEIFPAQKLLAKSMGLTSLQLAKKMKEGAIKGKKPLLKLLAQMNTEYEHGTAKMAKTFDGQLANIKEQSKFVLGTLMEPLFHSLEDEVFPALGEFGDKWQKVMSDSTKTSEEKWYETKQLANTYLKPIVSDIGKWIEKEDIPGKIGDALDTALPIIMDKGTKLAKEAAKRFLQAWLHASLATKLFTGWLLLAKFGVFGRLATMATEVFMRRWQTKMGSKGAEAMMTGIGGKWGMWLARGSIAALAAYGFYQMYTHKKEATPDQISKARGGPTRGVRSQSAGHGTTAWGGRAGIEARRRARETAHGQMGNFPQMAYPSPAASRRGAGLFAPGSILERPAMPRGSLKGLVQNHVTVEVDGREINKVVKTRQRDLKARK
jgi:tape measure domain-containing protein